MSDKYHEPIPGYILLNLKQILNMEKKNSILRWWLFFKIHQKIKEDWTWKKETVILQVSFTEACEADFII